MTVMPPSDHPSPAPRALLGDALDMRTLFPTPLIIAELTDAATVNPALREIVLAREAATPSVRKSNSGGWQSDTDFEEWSAAPGAIVLEAARQLGTRMTVVQRQTELVRADFTWRVNAWANINRRGNSNHLHSHGGAFWSGAYYVDDGADGDAEALGGSFEMADPRGVMPQMYAPNLKMGLRGCITAGLSEFVSPRAGQFLLFPSWLVHAVAPYQGPGARISIAFNLCV